MPTTSPRFGSPGHASGNPIPSARRAASRPCAPRHPASRTSCCRSPTARPTARSARSPHRMPAGGPWRASTPRSSRPPTAPGWRGCGVTARWPVRHSADAVRAHRELLRRWPELSAAYRDGDARGGGRAGLAATPSGCPRRGQRVTAPVDDGLVVQGLGGGLREVLGPSAPARPARAQGAAGPLPRLRARPAAGPTSSRPCSSSSTSSASASSCARTRSATTRSTSSVASSS